MDQNLEEDQQQHKTSGRMAAAIDLIIDYLLKEYGQGVDAVRISKPKPKNGPPNLQK